jgi:hypothetical protein
VFSMRSRLGGYFPLSPLPTQLRKAHVEAKGGGYQNPFRSMAPFCTAISIDPVPLPSIPCTCSPVKFRERLLSASARLETLKFPFWIQLLLSSSESRAIRRSI